MSPAISFLAALRRRVSGSRDDGFTLVELMVALSIFTLVMVGFAYGLQTSLGVTRDNRLRTQGSQLAARELEIVRNEFSASDDARNAIGASSVVENPHQMSGGTPGQPLRMDGTDFTVRRSVQWLPTGVGQSTCDGSTAEVTYPSLAVNVRVSWQEGQRTVSIENNTVLTPPKDKVDGDIAFIAAKVVGADGTGVAGVPVSISGPGGPQTRSTIVDTEDASGANGGCAVFPILVAGAYTVTLNQPGYITFDGQQLTSKSITVNDETIKVVPFSYDRVATLHLEKVTRTGWPLFGESQSTTLFNPSLPPTGTKVVPAGTTTLGNLWPSPDGYTGWVGTCEANDPAIVGGTRPDPVVVEPGDTGTLQLPLTPLTITVVDGENEPKPGKTIVAVVVKNGSLMCGPFTIGTTGADGVLKTSLTAGTWAMRLDTEPFCNGRAADDPCQSTPTLTGALDEDGEPMEVPFTLVMRET